MISAKVNKTWLRYDGKGRKTLIVWATSGFAHMCAAWCLTPDGNQVWKYVTADLVGWKRRG